MSFLSRFSSASAPSQAEGEVFARRRTFSAAQYRDEELARAAEARVAREAADQAAQEAADAFRAARLADAEEDESEQDEFGAPGEPPMDWEEAVGWLSTRSAEARNFIAHSWNWEHDLRVLQFLMSQPDTDLGVATGVFWLTGATDDFFPWGDEDSPADPQFQRAADMVDQLGRRFAAEDFGSARYGFDDSGDCSALKERLEELYEEGRIDWSPANLTTVSPAELPTLDDVPEDERREVREFLARHGV